MYTLTKVAVVNALLIAGAFGQDLPEIEPVGTINGKNYYLQRENYRHDLAVEYCHSLGFELAYFNDAAEADYIQSRLPADLPNDTKLWTAGVCHPVLDDFHWIVGSEDEMIDPTLPFENDLEFYLTLFSGGASDRFRVEPDDSNHATLCILDLNPLSQNAPVVLEEEEVKICEELEKFAVRKSTSNGPLALEFLTTVNNATYYTDRAVTNTHQELSRTCSFYFFNLGKFRNVDQMTAVKRGYINPTEYPLRTAGEWRPTASHCEWDYNGNHVPISGDIDMATSIEASTVLDLDTRPLVAVLKPALKEDSIAQPLCMAESN